MLGMVSPGVIFEIWSHFLRKLRHEDRLKHDDIAPHSPSYLFVPDEREFLFAPVLRFLLTPETCEKKALHTRAPPGTLDPRWTGLVMGA